MLHILLVLSQFPLHDTTRSIDTLRGWDDGLYQVTPAFHHVSLGACWYMYPFILLDGERHWTVNVLPKDTT